MIHQVPLPSHAFHASDPLLFFMGIRRPKSLSLPLSESLYICDPDFGMRQYGCCRVSGRISFTFVKTFEWGFWPGLGRGVKKAILDPY
jgi:hypothetical protein